MKKEQRPVDFIIARGEHSNHCHVVVGDVEVERNKDGEILMHVGSEGAVMKHLLETEWLNGNEVWTGEHKDIPLTPGDHKYVPQVEYHPYDKEIRRVYD